MLSSWLRVPAISTGEMLRSEAGQNTALGLAAQQIMSSGGLVGDDIVNEMLVDRLQRSDCRTGYVLDGFPRTAAQAKFLDKHLAREGEQPTRVIHLDLSRDTLIERMSSRRECPVCGRIYNLLHQPPLRMGVCDDDGTVLIRRKDDHHSVIRARLLAYENMAAPVLEHYRGRGLQGVNGNQSADLVFEDIAAALEPLVRIRTQRMRSE
jgi:adenylate kinase